MYLNNYVIPVDVLFAYKLASVKKTKIHLLGDVGWKTLTALKNKR